MEVLETARVEVFAMNEIVIESDRRNKLLCVVWEGTCVEKQLGGEGKLPLISETTEEISVDDKDAVWHAGDWTGPIALQPDKRFSGESDSSQTHDVVAMSSQGVKVITIEFSSLHSILKSGSPLYAKYLDRRAKQERRMSFELTSQAGSPTQMRLAEALKSLNIVDLLDQNFALRKLSAVQKRHMESLAVGPIGFEPGERLWRDGAPVEKAFLIVSGTASFVPKRRNAGSTTVSMSIDAGGNNSVKEQMLRDAALVADEDSDSDGDKKEDAPNNQVQLETLFTRSNDGRVKSMTEANDFADLSRNLQKRAEMVTSGRSLTEEGGYDWEEEPTESLPENPADKRSFLARKGSVRARFENKVLGRIHSREAYTGGLVFSRGHFLGDISRMFYGHVNTDSLADNPAPAFDFSSESLKDRVIQEKDSEDGQEHSSTLIAGKDGCVVLEFDKSTLIPFLDEYPGLLLSLLGTQVVV